jgi:hypothetical protein
MLFNVEETMEAFLTMSQAVEDNYLEYLIQGGRKTLKQELRGRANSSDLG